MTMYCPSVQQTSSACCAPDCVS